MNSSFAASFRRSAFWAMDAFRNPSVRNQQEDLRQQLTGGLGPSAVQQARLRALLAHATSTTTHYRQYDGCKELAQFPVVQKRQISEHRDTFESSVYAGRKLPVMSTSGSTGMPMQFRLSGLKRRRQQAEIIYFSELVGFKLGMRHANVRIIRSKRPLRFWMENQVLFDPSVITEAWLKWARRELKHPTMAFLTGYARPIAMLAAYCQAHDDAPGMFSLQAVVPTAEGLSIGERQLIQAMFGCPVFNRYASQEFGVLAQECPHDRLHLNTASYVFELLALDTDRPVPPGQPGRVVVTDLFSHAMPLIRYDLGDLAVLEATPCPCGRPTPALSELQGRLVETILDTRGRRLSPFILVNHLREVQGITQFRFIQKAANSYELVLVTAPGFSKETHVIQIMKLLRQYLGEDANVKITRVSDIAPLCSGKRPYVVNEHLSTALGGNVSN